MSASPANLYKSPPCASNVAHNAAKYAFKCFVNNSRPETPAAPRLSATRVKPEMSINNTAQGNVSLRATHKEEGEKHSGGKNTVEEEEAEEEELAAAAAGSVRTRNA